MPEKIPYHRPFPLPEKELNELVIAIKSVIESGDLTNGVFVEILEERIKELYDVEYVIATSNCTMGLFLCFQYEGTYNTVHMPNFTWISPYLCIPNDKKFCDIDKETWLIKDYNKLDFWEKSLTGTKDNFLLFPTHTFGNIIEIERDYHVIYDGAHALGSKIRKFGDATVLSLAPTKLITSCEGGLVLTNQKYLADFVRFRRDKCARMSEVHALIGLATLPYLGEVLKWKEMVYHYYKSYIPGQFQVIPINSNYNTIGFLNTENLRIPEHITTKQYYEPVYQVDLLPNAYEVYKQMVCLPSYYQCPYVDIVDNILELNNL